MPQRLSTEITGRNVVCKVLTNYPNHLVEYRRKKPDHTTVRPFCCQLNAYLFLVKDSISIKVISSLSETSSLPFAWILTEYPKSIKATAKVPMKMNLYLILLFIFLSLHIVSILLSNRKRSKRKARRITLSPLSESNTSILALPYKISYLSG